MGTRIAVTEQDFGAATDKSWINAREGLDEMRSGTLDISTFSPAHIASGVIPSGTALGRIASSGKYGPYNAEASGANSKFSVVATGGSAGDFTLTFDGETTAAIAYNATAAQVKTALVALSNLDADEVVTGGGPLPTTAVTIEFVGDRYGGEAHSLTKTNENVTGGDAVVTTVQAGGTADGRENFAGFLFEACKVESLADADCGFALFWCGIVRWDRLPAFTFGMGDETDAGTIGSDDLEDFDGVDVGYLNKGRIRVERVVP